MKLNAAAGSTGVREVSSMVHILRQSADRVIIERPALPLTWLPKFS